jgi:hypothetical protein
MVGFASLLQTATSFLVTLNSVRGPCASSPRRAVHADRLVAEKTLCMNFDECQTRRLGCCLTRLLPHVDDEGIALTGGVAIEVHLAARGLRRQQQVVGDLDFVTRRREAVSPDVAAVFLVSHFHKPQPGYPKFMIQLVDPVSRLRVDIFPDQVGSIQRAAVWDIAGARVRILDPEAILDHKLATLAKASAGRRVDEKHYQDAVLLGNVCGRPVPSVPAAHLCHEGYSQDLAAECPRCDASLDATFPLAPKQQILDVLGYV